MVSLWPHFFGPLCELENETDDKKYVIVLVVRKIKKFVVVRGSRKHRVELQDLQLGVMM